jgi:hypothetical protein
LDDVAALAPGSHPDGMLEDVLRVAGHEVGLPERVPREHPLQERLVRREIDVVAPHGQDRRVEPRERPPVAVACQEVRVEKIGPDPVEDPPHLPEGDGVVKGLHGDAGSDVVDDDPFDRRGLHGHEMHLVSVCHEVAEPSLRVDVPPDRKIRDSHDAPSVRVAGASRSGESPLPCADGTGADRRLRRPDTIQRKSHTTGTTLNE